MDVENDDVIDGRGFMNSHAIYEAKNPNSIDDAKKIGENFLNVYEMEDTRLKDGVDIDDIFSASTLHRYFNMECNNESRSPFNNGKMSP